MTFLQAVVLGAVQGLTEFLPISSSGHLLIIPKLLGWQPQGLVFDLTVHLATLLAIVIAMRAELRWLWDGFWRGERARVRLVWKLLGASVPALLAGFFLADWFAQFRNVETVAISLIVWGIFLGLADRFSALMRGQIKDLGHLQWWQAMLIGVIQIFALVPGTSRSGATMTAGLFAGLERTATVRFSFLLAIPVIGAAGLSTALTTAQSGLELALSPMLVGFASALLFGILAIKVLLWVVQNASFVWFAVYRVALGIFLLLYL